MSERARLRFSLFILDGIGLELAFFVVFFLRFRTGLFVNPVHFYATELIFPSLVLWMYWVLVGAFFSLYRFDPEQGRSEIASYVFQTTAAGILVLFIVTFEYSDPLPRSRAILLSYWGLTYLALAGDRVFLLTLIKALRRRGIGLSRTLLVGTGLRARELLAHVKRFPEFGFHLIGVASEKGDGPKTWESLPVIGEARDLAQLRARCSFDAVLFALDPAEEAMLPDLVRSLSSQSPRVFVPADQYPILLGSVRPQWIYGHPLMAIHPEVLSVGERALKRAVDIIASLTLLVLSFPIWLLLCALIPLDSRGPVFYIQNRVGKGGRIFSLVKFRSMVKNAEAKTGPAMAQTNDIRVTRLGRFLRKTHLDEIPQFLNVLVGHMSLVGPRPERPEFVDRFRQEIPLYERRLNVKPGVTGWAHIHQGYAASVEEIAVRLRHDLYYIEKQSLLLDLQILLMTLLVVLRGEGR